MAGVHCFVLLGLVIGLWSTATLCQSEDECASRTSCSQCTSVPECAWCKDPTINQLLTLVNRTRCAHRDTISSLCLPGEIEDPRSQVVNADQGSATIIPQVASINLRPGEPASLEFTVNTPSEKPLDIYFLFDVSSSLNNDLDSFEMFSSELLLELQNLTSSLHLGIGTFIDKPIIPYTPQVPFMNIFGYCISNTDECVPAYSFRNLLPLTSNTTVFQSVLSSSLNVSFSVDTLEGSLDAMLQVAVCKELIGWRDNAQKLLIVLSDAPPHVAGDGKVGGILTPNDGRCHLEVPHGGKYLEYSMWHELDYASIYQVRDALRQFQITPIFGTSTLSRPIYQSIQKHIEQSLIGVFDASGSSFVDVAQEEAKNAILRQVIIVEDRNLQDFQYNITAIEGCDRITEGHCEAPPGTVIKYLFTISTQQRCLSPRNLTINVFGVGTISVTVDVYCQCSCEDNPVFNYTECSGGRGTLVCGECSCSNLPVEYECPASNSLACSGHGVCTGCGECICETSPSRSYNGEACEFDDSCLRDPVSGELCGGRGNCSNGNCFCIGSNETGLPYTGPLCDCSPDNSSCINPEAQQRGLCSQHGECTCNKCECTSEYGGEFCELCLTVSCLSCEASKQRVLCVKGQSTEPCMNYTSTLILLPFTDTIQDNITRNYSGLDINQCEPLLVEECLHQYYTIENPLTGELIIVADSQTRCIINPVPWIIIAVIFLVVFSTGILILAIIKFIIMYLDYKEVKRLEKEAKNPIWQRELNPLYVNPTKEYTNIAYLIRQKKKREEEENKRTSAILMDLNQNLDDLFPELASSERPKMKTSTSMPTFEQERKEIVKPVLKRPTSAVTHTSFRDHPTLQMLSEGIFTLDTLQEEHTLQEKDAESRKNSQTYYQKNEESDDNDDDEDEEEEEEDGIEDEEIETVDISWQYPDKDSTALASIRQDDKDQDDVDEEENEEEEEEEEGKQGFEAVGVDLHYPNQDTPIPANGTYKHTTHEEVKEQDEEGLSTAMNANGWYPENTTSQSFVEHKLPKDNLLTHNGVTAPYTNHYIVNDQSCETIV